MERFGKDGFGIETDKFGKESENSNLEVLLLALFAEETSGPIGILSPPRAHTHTHKQRHVAASNYAPVMIAWMSSGDNCKPAPI